MAVVPIRGLNRMKDIEKAARLAKEAIGRVPGAAIQLSSDALDKLRWLANGGRDFREDNRTMKARVNGAFASALMDVIRGRARVSEPWRAAAEEYRDVLAERLASGGGDVKAHMRKLRPATIARKGHSRIGVDSGALLREVTKAPVKVTKGE